MQRTKSKILSILLSLVMLLSLVPAMGVTALAADSYPAANAVFVDGDKDFSSQRYYRNTDTAGNFTGTSTDYNAHYDSATGTLTLNGYEGGRITLGGASYRDLTIKLIGNNTVTVGSGAGIVANSTGCNITITADNGSSGKLTITATSGSGDAYGIGTGLASGAVSGNVTIKGYADVTINATTNGLNDYSFGIYAGEVVIEDHAKVAIYAKAPSNTVDDQVYGIYAKTNVTINTDNEITVDASDAGTGYSTGVNAMGTLTLTKAGRMTVKWNGNSGAPFYPTNKSFSDTDHAINVDKEMYSTTIDADTGSGQKEQEFTFNAVAKGTYDLVVTKACHLTYTIKNVEVGDTPLNLTTMTGKAYSTITLLCGDIDGNGFINSTDLGIILKGQNYGKSTATAGDKAADLDGNGFINSTDLGIVLQGQHYGKSAVSVNFAG